MALYALAGQASFRNTNTRDSAATRLEAEAATRGLKAQAALDKGAGVVRMTIGARPGFTVCYVHSDFDVINQAANDLYPYLDTNQYEGDFGLYQIEA